jgi:hypothetical protein
MRNYSELEIPSNVERVMANKVSAIYTGLPKETLGNVNNIDSNVPLENGDVKFILLFQELKRKVKILLV